ncbi:Nucleoporin Nup85-like protein [Artemisia annua]|uniref:Nucleoporin Nup85-like protein n=1 Tax=Artemisia annua TaxID=35608 RepID=A0A2U1NXU3_ARTAN|nr:Nucleoporin Nup85-like protein [Artemisia annua]
MPGLLTNSDNQSSTIVPFSPEPPTLYNLHHGLKPPLAPRISISWSRGNSLRLSIFKSPDNHPQDENKKNAFMAVSESMGYSSSYDAEW